MPYREDEDALLARADALEREAEELRRENQRLRDAAVATPASTVEHRVVEVPVEVSHAAKSSVLALSLSLQNDSFDWVLVVPTIAGTIAILALVASKSAGGLALGVTATLIFLWLCFRVSVAGRKRQIRGEEAWIASRPLGLDPQSYRALLSEHHETRRVIARVGFARELPETERREIATRLAVDSRWENDLLVIASPMLDTVRTRNKVRLHESSLVHRWVRRLVEQLATITDGYPVDRIFVHDEERAR